MKSLISIILGLMFTLVIHAETLIFGLPEYHLSTPEAQQAMLNHYKPLMAYLEKATGDNIEIIGYPKVKDFYRALIKGEVDFAFCPLYIYYRANQKNNHVQALVTVKRHNQLLQRFVDFDTTHILTLKEYRNFTKINHLHHENIGFLKDNSAAGFIYPVAELKKRNISYKDFFSKTKFYTSYDQLITALIEKKIQAGAVEDTAWLNNPHHNLFKSLLTISTIPNPPYVTTEKLSHETKPILQEALLHAPISAFKDLDYVGFKPTPAGFYDASFKLFKKEKTKNG